MIVVSSCLAGENCRYDGKSCSNGEIVDLLKSGQAIAVCPEELGGLPTPREPAERIGKKVIDKKATDVTDHFILGAEKAYEIAMAHKVTKAIVKEKSPMCGLKTIYDGTFSGRLIDGSGVFTQKLKEAGIEVEAR